MPDGTRTSTASIRHRSCSDASRARPLLQLALGCGNVGIIRECERECVVLCALRSLPACRRELRSYRSINSMWCVCVCVRVCGFASFECEWKGKQSTHTYMSPLWLSLIHHKNFAVFSRTRTLTHTHTRTDTPTSSHTLCDVKLRWCFVCMSECVCSSD